MNASRKATVISILLVCACASLWLPTMSSRAQAQAQTESKADRFRRRESPGSHPLTFTLRLVIIKDAPTEDVWMIDSPANYAVENQAAAVDGLAFRSLASPKLRSWLSERPLRTIITYMPYAVTDFSLARPGEVSPATAHENQRKRDAEIEAFSKYCQSEGLQFRKTSNVQTPK